MTLMLLGGLPCGASEFEKINEIKITMNDWTSQRVLSIVFGEMLKQIAYQPTYHKVSVQNQWGGLTKGHLHVQIEVWQASMEKSFVPLVEQGKILDMGEHPAKTREDWWYPEYVEARCPGLPEWRALLNCSHIFKRPNSRGKGVYFTGPWDYNDADIIRAFNLNFTIMRLKDQEELNTKIRLASEKKTPIMAINWTPNWTDTRIPGKFVEFPDYHPDCETDQKWGVNPHLKYDCGNPKNGWLKKAAWPGIKKHACVMQLLKVVEFKSDMLAEAAALVIGDGMKEEDAAKRWMEVFEIDIKKWLNQSGCYQ
ncbi:ABC transporter substrate-binding protein [Algicola sagamiensis]|uniref:ABC transporter substrate-binding protein n=1 Tax=Algicola sagamiensis TaxID=163869 RepID=UPI000378C58C|nr:ABC transporter substrate-binding protein [Algicola sagamiensis]